MYYGHVKRGVVLLTEIVKSGRGYSVKYQFKGTNKKYFKPLSVVVNMLKAIPDYQITETSKSTVISLSQKGNKLADIVINDLKSGKCTICYRV